MVDHEDVIVRFPATAVDVRNDESISIRVHLLRQEIPKVVDVLNVVGIPGVKFLVAERLAVVQHLHLAAGVLCQGSGPSSEHARPAGHVTGDRDTPGIVFAPYIAFSVGSAVARAVVGGTHPALRSPSSSRTSRRSCISSGTST